MTTTATPATISVAPEARNIGRGGAKDARLLKIARRDKARAEKREEKYKARILARLQGSTEGFMEVKNSDGTKTRVNVVRLQPGFTPKVDWDLLLKRYPRVYKQVRSITTYNSIRVL